MCLNVGCIPSKALLHAAQVIADAEEMRRHGVEFGAPKIDLAKLRACKDGVVGEAHRRARGARQGAQGDASSRARARSRRRTTLAVDDERRHADRVASSTHHRRGLAGGAHPGLPDDDPRIMDSTGALELAEVPERLLVIGGGIIGLEMATVYDALGAKVTVVELMDRLIPGRRPRPRAAARAPHREALRGDPR